MLLRPEEPAAGPWRVERVASTVERLVHEFSAHAERPLLLGVDGRSSSGKTSLAHMIEHAVAASSTIHTDDVAWHHSIFGWDDLLIDGVLAPLRRGQAVHYRPPAWNERDRPGAITVPADRVLVVIEGVGVGRRVRCNRWCPVRDTCDLDDRVSTKVPVLWLCGPPGVGKTAVAWEVYTRLVRARR